MPAVSRIRNAPRTPLARSVRATCRPGFTLFEVILALVLAALVLALLGAAIRICVMSFDVGRTEVEEAELARGIFSRIAADLQAAVRIEAQDVSTIESMAEQSAEFDIESLDDPTLGGLGSLDDSGGSSSSSDSSDIAGAVEPPPAPGLYGNQFELQVDVSHIPRPDEFQVLLSEGSDDALVDRVSDIKTVAYYLQAGQRVGASSGSATGLAADATLAAGLVRRQLDRATGLWAVDTGNAALLASQTKLLAPEVSGIEFSYFDGLEWLTQWDTSELGGLPMAVKVRVWIRPREQPNETPTPQLPNSEGPQEGDIPYELTIHLRNAMPTSDAETGSTETDSSSESSDDDA